MNINGNEERRDCKRITPWAVKGETKNELIFFPGTLLRNGAVKDEEGIQW